MEQYEHLYDIRLLDDLHNYFPAFLYDQTRFQTVPDIFQYMNRQIDTHCNLFRRGLNQYNRNRNPLVNTNRQAPGRIVTQEVFDIFVDPRPVNNTVRVAPTTNATGIRATNATGSVYPFNPLLTEYLLSLLQPQANNYESVPVVPTVDQVDNSTSLRSAALLDEQENCSICQENYTEGQAIRTIKHCEHNFHKNCIDTWFERNVHCPVCRYDIRTQE